MARKIKRIGKRVGLWIGIAAIYVLPLVTVRGAFDCFLKIEGVPGESTDAKHTDWIEILSYSHGVSQPAGGITSSGGARSSGRVDHEDFSIVKTLDKTSPKLLLFCCNGQHIPKVQLELARTVLTEKKVYYKINLIDVIVTAVRPSGDAEGARDRPIEEVRFNYGKIQWIYTYYDALGKGQDYEAMWDVTQNTGD